MSCVRSRRSFADRVGRLSWFRSRRADAGALKEIFEATPKFLAKELRKLRATRAIAARIKSEFSILL